MNTPLQILKEYYIGRKKTFFVLNHENFTTLLNEVKYLLEDWQIDKLEECAKIVHLVQPTQESIVQGFDVQTMNYYMAKAGFQQVELTIVDVHIHSKYLSDYTDITFEFEEPGGYSGGYCYSPDEINQ